MNRPYKYTQQGRLVIQPPLQKSTTGVADITRLKTPFSHPYRGTLCRNTLGRAAGTAAPTEALEPPLQLNSVVVYHDFHDHKCR